jgi:hypothetical protein
MHPTLARTFFRQFVEGVLQLLRIYCCFLFLEGVERIAETIMKGQLNVWLKTIWTCIIKSAMQSAMLLSYDTILPLFCLQHSPGLSTLHSAGIAHRDIKVSIPFVILY